jgi:SAM-dependent methyltransferase
MNQKQISDTWERGNPYEQYIGRWSRQIAARFLSWIDCNAGLRWLDVGCGAGALCAAIVDHCAPILVAGIEPSAGFLKTARENLTGKMALSQSTATAIPLASSSVDVVVSGLVLNFLSDPHAALIEMARVTHQGGIIGAYVWDYAGKMEIIRLFWDIAIELDPDAAKLDEGTRFPQCNPESLQTLFAGTGLSEIKVAPIEMQAMFTSFNDYWQPFLGGQGPAPAYTMSLDDQARARLRDHLRKRLPMLPDGSISLNARAWAIRAIVKDRAMDRQDQVSIVTR